MLSCASDKAKLFVKNFSRNFDLDDTGISSVTPKMFKKFIRTPDFSEVSGPDCILRALAKKEKKFCVLHELGNKTELGVWDLCLYCAMIATDTLRVNSKMKQKAHFYVCLASLYDEK